MTIEHRYIIKIRQIASECGMTTHQLGKELVRMTSRKNDGSLRILQRQFRVNTVEFEAIRKSAEKMGINIGVYTQIAAVAFMREKNHEKYHKQINMSKTRRSARDKRITMRFGIAKEDMEFTELCRSIEIDASSILRFSALHYNSTNDRIEI